MRAIDANYVLDALGIFSDREHGEPHFLNGIETAREIVEQAPTVGGWISVEDRLPELATLALVYDAGSGKMAVARYIANNQWVLPAFFPAVTHWMLLPGAPKEDVDDDCE